MSKIDFFSPPELSDSQFQQLSEFIQTNVGIKMPAEKRLMVQSRLANRLKVLGINNYDDYLKFTFSNTTQGSEEIALMINAITTNLTVFFRENSHFEYLSNVVLPEFAQQKLKKIELWSAGCSSGQEPYTLSIVMQEFIRQNQNSINDYSILATDISSRVLDKAIDAVYPMSEIENLPYELKKRYFLKSKNQENPSVRVKPETRQKVNFARLNFMDSSYPKTTQKNVIFCRNVLIYFDKKTQESVVRKLLEHLTPGGYLFLGHSETIFGMDLPLKTVGPTIFKKI